MMQLLKRIQVRVPIYERYQTDDGFGTQRTVRELKGYRTATVDVEVAMNEVTELAEKAAQNKTKRSKSGPVYCKAFFN